MDYCQTILLALIQGITEFLPISSSAHLILPAAIFGWQDQGLAFDTAVHLGTLLAVIGFFRADIYSLSLASIQHLKGHPSTESRFCINLLIASLPIIPAGLLLKGLIENELRSIDVIIITTLLFAVLLLIADRIGQQTKPATELGWRDALLIGISQCFALIPGTSRSGVTMTLALFLGYTRESASRISFLLAIPAIAGASTLKSIDLIRSDVSIDWHFLLVGVSVAFISAYICIKLFLDYINRIGFLPFVIYRLLLGVLLIWLVA
ncbi:MAG: undecaprenyl-diphosphate phosphatase [Pseudomonadales bacterium]|nr:undecaprenyl-diphosphate phosphatase [Pseudomonadales bacterium]